MEKVAVLWCAYALGLVSAVSAAVTAYHEREDAVLLDVTTAGHRARLSARALLGPTPPAAVIFTISNDTFSNVETLSDPAGGSIWEHEFGRPLITGGEYNGRVTMVCEPRCASAAGLPVAECGACFGTAILTASRRVRLPELAAAVPRVLLEDKGGGNDKNTRWWVPSRWRTATRRRPRNG